MVKRFFIFALLVVMLGTSGCVSGMLAKMAVQAPNQQRVPRVVRNAEYAARCDAVYSEAWRLRVGPPAAELSVAVVEPGDYHFHHQITVQTWSDGRKRLVPKSEWTVPSKERVPVRGTVLLLHGYMDSKEDILHWALCLAESGYRCVLVDFRGHGRSNGDWIGFGAFEVKDLSQLLDDLERRGLLAGKIGVLGISYGGSIGLQLSARDSRVGAAVALEPFSNAEKAVVEFAHGVAPKQAARISDATFAAALVKAPRLGKFSWKETDVLADAARVTIPTLFIHGAKDRWLSPEHSRILNSRVRGPSQLIILPDDDHLLLSMRLTPVARDVKEFFDREIAVKEKSTAPTTSVALP